MPFCSGSKAAAAAVLAGTAPTNAILCRCRPPRLDLLRQVWRQLWRVVERSDIMVQVSAWPVAVQPWRRRGKAACSRGLPGGRLRHHRRHHCPGSHPGTRCILGRCVGLGGFACHGGAACLSVDQRGAACGRNTYCPPLAVWVERHARSPPVPVPAYLSPHRVYPRGWRMCTVTISTHDRARTHR